MERIKLAEKVNTVQIIRTIHSGYHDTKRTYLVKAKEVGTQILKEMLFKPDHLWPSNPYRERDIGSICRVHTHLGIPLSHTEVQLLDGRRILYLVYTYYRYGSVEKFLKNHRSNPVPLTTATRIIDGVAHGAQELHKAKYVHFDVSHENVVVTPEFSSKLIDFEMLQPMQSEPRCTTDWDFGTPEYISPEFFDKDGMTSINEGRDTYAIGVLFYYLLANRLPYILPNKREKALEFAHSKKGYFRDITVPLHRINKSVPNNICDVVDACLEYDFRNRCAIGELLTTVNGYL